MTAAMIPAAVRNTTAMSSSRIVLRPSAGMCKGLWDWPRVSKLVSQQWLCCLTLLCTWDVNHTWTAREILVCVSMKWRGNCDDQDCGTDWFKKHNTDRRMPAINFSFRLVDFLRDRASLPCTDLCPLPPFIGVLKLLEKIVKIVFRVDN